MNALEARRLRATALLTMQAAMRAPGNSLDIQERRKQATKAYAKANAEYERLRNLEMDTI
jgi:hypothetical protein